MPASSFDPKSKKKGDKVLTRTQTAFIRAMMTGPPASELPQGALRWLYNAVAYQTWVQGRYGSRNYTSTALPGLPNRDKLDGEKSGTIITSNNAAFTEDDVSNYWVWDDLEHEQILEYISATQVRVATSENKDGLNCYLRGKHNGWFFHKGQRKAVIQLGGTFYVSDNLNLTSWTALYCLTSESPNNAISDFDEFGDEVVAFNSNGVYRLFIEPTIPYTYRCNMPGPSTYISSITKTDALPYGRRYIYGTARLTENQPVRTRATGGVAIEQEGSPNIVDADLRDYGEVWTELPRGNNTKTRGVLTGPVVANANLDVVNVWAAVNDGTATFTLNGLAFTIWVDFTGVQTMQEVAGRIQTVMRQYWQDSTCEFDANRFIVTSGFVNGTTFDAVAAGVGGTDITAAGYTNLIAGEIANGVVFAEPLIVGRLNVPVRPDDPTRPQIHWTHYTIYCDLDIGVNGTDPITGVANNPERFIWTYDLRIAAAFFGSKDTLGVVTATVGEFELADVGSTIEWDNGDRDTITEYINSTQVRVTDAIVIDYGEDATFGAFAIGNGKVYRVSQTLDVITRTHGSRFQPQDVGKSFLWSTGYRSIIVRYLSPNAVQVADSNTRQVQGGTLDPTYRYFYDTIDDDLLRTRSSDYLIKNRTYTPLPLTNIGRITPGWLFTAVRGDSRVYYHQLVQEQRYLIGAHNAGWQVNEDVKDAIQSIDEYPNRIIFFCANSVYGAPTNTSVSYKIPSIGELLSILSGVQILDANLGVTDWGSITDVDIGRQQMRTTDDAWREFDGFKFGKNLAEDSEGYELVMDQIRAWRNATATGYRYGELFLWGLR